MTTLCGTSCQMMEGKFQTSLLRLLTQHGFSLMICVYSTRYRVKFFDLQEPDGTTLEWISESKAKSGDLWLQIWHIVVSMINV